MKYNKIANMKYCFPFVLILSLNGNIYSQENNFTIRTGGGYYADVMGMYDGSIIWIEGGYKLKTGFYFNSRLSIASIDWTIGEGIFSGYSTIATRQMLDITFSKPLLLTGRNFFEIGFGFKLKKESSFYPDLTIQNVGGQSSFYTRYSNIFMEIGFTICLDYYYQFQNNFYLGLRADSNVIWAIGFEGLTFSPLFGFRF